MTEANYKAYLRERDLGVREPRFLIYGRRCQGVGPLQLTYWAYQDRADAAGGCWDPQVNLNVGASILRELAIRDDMTTVNWVAVARRWNGSQMYADQIRPKLARWKSLLNGV